MRVDWLAEASFRARIELALPGGARRGAIVEAELPSVFSQHGGIEAFSLARSGEPRRLDSQLDHSGGKAIAIVAADAPMADSLDAGIFVYPADKPTQTKGRGVAVEIVEWRGQESFEVSTPTATYRYHRRGAGLASLVDRRGREWIGYRPGRGPGGEYRGIPNAGGAFHPGFPTPDEGVGCDSELESAGPLRARVRSASKDGEWECTWDFFSDRARLEILRAPGRYSFLYEGTPAGRLRKRGQWLVDSRNVVTSLADDREDSLPIPKWCYFAAGGSILYIDPHASEDAPDQYWPMRRGRRGNAMTVFALGRKHRSEDAFLERLPARFEIGVMDDLGFERNREAIEGARSVGVTEVLTERRAA